jgi:hypothetical protein
MSANNSDTVEGIARNEWDYSLRDIPTTLRGGVHSEEGTLFVKGYGREQSIPIEIGISAEGNVARLTLTNSQARQLAREIEAAVDRVEK